MGLLLRSWEDYPGHFDVHHKNLVRAGNLPIPFDVISFHMAGGFPDFIEEALAASRTLHALRIVTHP